MAGGPSDYLELRSSDPAPPGSSQADGVRLYAANDGSLRTVQSDGTDAAIGSGGSAVTARDHLGGRIPEEQVTVSNFDTQQLPWHSRGDPGATPLFDLTDPLNPLILTEGIYSFYAEVLVDDSMTAAGYHFCSLIVDSGGSAAQADALSAQATADLPKPRCIMQITWYCPAGAQVQMFVENDDGSASRTFRLSEAWVQKVT